MMKVKFIALTFLIMLFTSSCIAGEEMEKAKKYKLEYVYIEEQLELKEQSELKIFSFIANESSERFTLDLYYLNFKHLFAPKDKENLVSIYQSLVGFSLEMYDKKTNELIYSYEITDMKKPSVSAATPSLFLGNGIKIKNKQEYEIKIKIPAKKDTQSQYSRPTFIAGIVPKPQL